MAQIRLEPTLSVPPWAFPGSLGRGRDDGDRAGVGQVCRVEARPLAAHHVVAVQLLDREGPLTTAALAAAEKMRPQSMGQTIAGLEAQGLVSRRPDAHDGRRKLLELTAAGREVLADDRRRRVGWLAEAIDAELSGEERDVLRRSVPLLERLAEL